MADSKEQQHQELKIRPSDIPPVATAISGALGGAIANLATFPLDLIVTRLQVQDEDDDGDIEKQDKSKGKAYDGVIDAMKKIYNKYGLLEFYAGAAGDTVATTATAFFYFYAYEFLRTRRVQSIARKKGGKTPGNLGAAEELAIGTVAGMFCKFIVSPLNNIVIRQQADGRGKSIAQVAREIYSEKGIQGFWTGYSKVIFLSVNPSLTYYFFQLLKTVSIPRRRRENPTGLEIFFLSASAKTVATLLTYPLILSKTRLQVAGSAGSSAREMFRHHGIKGLYQGARGQILKGFFSQGITMMSKDKIARLIIYLYVILWLKK